MSKKKYLASALIALLLFAVAQVSPFVAEAQDQQADSGPVVGVIPVGNRPDGPDGTLAVGVNPNTNMVYVLNGFSDSVTVIDGSTNEVVGNIPVGYVEYTTMVVDPYSNMIYVGATSDGGQIVVVDGSTNTLVAKIPDQIPPLIGPCVAHCNVKAWDYGGISDMVVLPDSSVYIASGNSGDVTKLWNTGEEYTSDVISNPKDTGLAKRFIDANPNTNMIYVANGDAQRIFVIDGNTDSFVTTILLPFTPLDIAVNPNTNMIYINSYDKVLVIDGSTNKIIPGFAMLETDTSGQKIAVNPNTNTVYLSHVSYVSGLTFGGVSVIDGFTNSVLATVRTFYTTPPVALNPNTDMVYVAGDSYKVYEAEKVPNVVFVIDGSKTGTVTVPPTLKRTFVLGEVLLVLKDGIDPYSEQVQSAVASVGGQIIQVIEEINVILISVPMGSEEQVIEQLQQSDIIEFVDKNKYIVPASIDIRDIGYKRQEKHYEMINLPDAWSSTMGSNDVTVAVIDTGIDLDHPDLQENIWTNDDSCDDGVDNDSNNFVDDCLGWNFYLSTNNPVDDGGSWPGCDGHGTHVSGIVGAMSNEIGGVGVAPSVTIMPLKVFTHEDVEGDIVCVTSEAAVAQAIIYAVDNGAEVINASLQCSNGNKCDMPAVGDAFKYAHDKGVLAVVAAGNEAGEDDWQGYADNILEVSAVDLSEELAEYSNTGPGVKLTAPGSEVYSTKFDDRFGIMSGTSQATPMVVGCAALLLSADNSLTNVDVEKILIESAKDIGDNGRDDFYGNGLLDCNAALSSLGKPLKPEPTTPDQVGVGDISVAMKHKKKVTLVSVKNNGDEEISGVQMKIDDGKITFVKARGWDRDRIDQSTVIVQTNDRALKPKGMLIMILIVDNKDSTFEWSVFDLNERLIGSGDVSPK